MAAGLLALYRYTGRAAAWLAELTKFVYIQLSENANID